MHLSLDDASLTIALALAAGMFAQSLARHLRVPGIVLLLGFGVLLGPDLLNVIRPDTTGGALQSLVGFAVAVILFEGGLNLKVGRLRRQAKSIRQLVTVGALVTAAGASTAALWILGWDWRPAVLFGTLMIVTGPTVVTPLLRRIRVRRKVATVLEAEGVLGDAIGAICAVVALQVVLTPSALALAEAAWGILARLGFGLLAGLIAGYIIALLLRVERIVPEGMQNVFTLSMAFAMFHLSNALLHESGIVTVTVAGLVVGNVRTPSLSDLREFKEQVTVMLIGMLFVLLAADVRIDDVRALGWPGVWTVLALMFIVRPLNVLVGTWGSSLLPKERLFLCWLAPRGIVAAAVSSLFAASLSSNGIPGGTELRALVFLVIGVTVLFQGLSGGIVAQLLGLRRPMNTGYVILGANQIALSLGRVLREAGQEVVFIDSNPAACGAAEAEDFRVLFGNAHRESILQRAGMDGRAGCMAITPNDEANLLFARTAREEFKVPRVWVALRSDNAHVSETMVHESGARVLFGQPRNVSLWNLRLERDLGVAERWRRTEPGIGEELHHMEKDARELMLPLALVRGSRVLPLDESLTSKEADLLHVVLFQEKLAEARAWLQGQGWSREEPEKTSDSEPAAPGGAS